MYRSRGQSVRDDLTTILEAVRITALNQWSLQGFPSRYLNNDHEDPASEHQTTAPQCLINDIQIHLYKHCYTRAAACATNPSEPQSLTAHLRGANKGKPHWESNWSIVSTQSEGRLLAKRGHRHCAVAPGTYILEEPRVQPPGPGDRLKLWVAVESTQLQQGYFYVLGENLPDHYEDYCPTRIYFNTVGEGAAPLVRALSTHFNRFQVPFRFKLPTDVAGYARADAAVLYIARRDYPISMLLLKRLEGALRPTLDEAVPMFSKFIAPGIGLAEDPGTGESFGMSRTRLVAQGLVCAYEAGHAGITRRLRCIEQAFEAAGLNLDKPYLNPGSVDFPHPGPQGGLAL